MNNKIKILLIASLILNIAFITGFIVKRIISSSSDRYDYRKYKYYDSEFRRHNGHGQKSPHHLPDDRHRRHIYKKFKDNPEFKAQFDEYLKKFNRIQKELMEIKSAVLEELKKEDYNIKKINYLQEKINRLHIQLNKDNLDHFISLKKAMSAEEFKELIGKINRKLCKHQDIYKDFTEKKIKQNNQKSQKRQGGEK